MCEPDQIANEHPLAGVRSPCGMQNSYSAGSERASRFFHYCRARSSRYPGVPESSVLLARLIGNDAAPSRWEASAVISNSMS